MVSGCSIHWMEHMTNTSFDRRSRNEPWHGTLKIAGLVSIAGASMFIVACASTPPPTAELAVSEAALAHAVSAGGAEGAPAEMAAARDKMQRATVAMIAKDYDSARSLAQQAQVDAQLAEARARSAKARKAASELKEDTRVLREEIGRKVP